MRTRGISAYNTQKYEMLADYLKDTMDSDETFPLWAYGLGKLPSYILPLSDEFVQMKNRHAFEITLLGERNLRVRIRSEELEARRERERVRMLYENNPRQFYKDEVMFKRSIERVMEAAEQEVNAERKRNTRRKLSDEKLKRKLERRRKSQ